VDGVAQALTARMSRTPVPNGTTVVMARLMALLPR
jgi:hypothetical protein